MIQTVASAFDTAFPGRVRAIYMVGSYAGDYAVAGSDIDLNVVLSGVVTAEDREQADTLVSALGLTTDIELDIGMVSEHDAVRPALVMASTLVYGDDVRDHLNMMALDDWIRERMHAGCYLICNLYDTRRPAAIPIAFPNPTAAFYGYTTYRANADVETTKNLVRATSWAATALTARVSRQFITSKVDLLDKCAAHLDTTQAAYIGDLFALCRDELQYRLPTSAAQHRKLRAICERNLAFENFYLATYRDFLLDELTADTGRIKHALDFLHLTAFCDPDVRAIVEHLQPGGDPDLAAAVNKALASINLHCP